MITFKNYLTEKLKSVDDKKIDTNDYLEHTNKKSTSLAIPGKILPHLDYDEIHNHPDIKPQNITPEHESAILLYTDSSSRMNKYLERHKAGLNNKPLNGQINKMSSVFTTENTNKKPLITWSGIPTKIGKKLIQFDNGTNHTFTRFTSTSTSYAKALGFAKSHADEAKKELHVLKCYNEPGSSISLAKHSAIPSENEVLLNHGNHITYLYTTQHKPEPSSTAVLYVHHIKVHNTHTPLEEYKNIK